MSIYTVCVLLATVYLVYGKENTTDVSKIEKSCNTVNKSANYVNITYAAEDLGICYRSMLAVQLNTTFENPECTTTDKLDEKFNKFIKELHACDDPKSNFNTTNKYEIRKRLYKYMLNHTHGENDTIDAMPCIKTLSIDTILHDCLNMNISSIPDIRKLNLNIFTENIYSDWRCDKMTKLKNCTRTALKKEPAICKPAHIDFIMDKFNIVFRPCLNINRTSDSANSSITARQATPVTQAPGGGPSTLWVSNSLLVSITLFLICQ